MKPGNLAIAMLLAIVPATASAQTYEDDPYAGDPNATDLAPGEAVPSVDVFYDQLAPYGVWVDEPGIGQVFLPDDPGYVPYTNGHWAYTDVGFTWISNEPFGWATEHYGRWGFSNHFGRWYWLPDTQWGPAWVDWQQAGSDVGWAPMPPEAVIDAGWELPLAAWTYAPFEFVLAPNVRRHFIPHDRIARIHREARPIEDVRRFGRREIVVGPSAATLRSHDVTVRPVRVQPRAIGRWTPSEARALTTRAQERRPAVEAENQRRIQSRPEIKSRVERQPTAPGRVERPNPPPRTQPQTQPQRVERPTPTPAPQPQPQPQPQPHQQPQPQQPHQQPRVEHPTKPPVEHPTKAPVEHPTAPPVEQPTTPPVEHPTKPPVEHPTTPPVEHPTPTPQPQPQPHAQPQPQPQPHAPPPPTPHAPPPPTPHAPPPPQPHAPPPPTPHAPPPPTPHAPPPPAPHAPSPPPAPHAPPPAPPPSGPHH